MDWEQQAQQRIEQIRKGDFVVEIVDSTDRPVQGATVRADMLRHDFSFGTAIACKLLINDSPDRDTYRRHILELFNRGTLENYYKWRFQEQDDTRQLADQASEWLLDNGMSIHGHTLIWQSFKYGTTPKDIVDMLKSDDDGRAEYVRRRALEHIDRTVRRYRGRIREWDVINENFSEHELVKVLDPDSPIEEAPSLVAWMQAARAADPLAALYVNDFGILVGDDEVHKASYERHIAHLIRSGAPIGGIGMQGHYTNGSKRRSPQQLIETLDRFAKFGLPIQITEFDMFGKLWGDTPEQIDSAQAEFLRQFLVTVFSHPAVGGFTMWGFWDGRHWMGNSPLLRKDWSPKPGYHVYRDLVLKRWWTNAAGASDAAGRYGFRGFYGTYRVQVEHQGRRVEREVRFDRGAGSARLYLAQ